LNFSALIEFGREAGLRLVSFERQASFLIRLGLLEMIDEEMTGSPLGSGLKQRLALKNLFVPGGVSDNFRVLIQEKLKFVDPTS
jgi:SAM-dependent MidA family methyltransferase